MECLIDGKFFVLVPAAGEASRCQCCDADKSDHCFDMPRGACVLYEGVWKEKSYEND